MKKLFFLVLALFICGTAFASFNNFKLNGEGKITGGSEITIDTTNAWQMLTNITEGNLFNGLTFEPGFDGAITAFADAGGGQVTVTSNGHSIGEGDFVSITGTTNYNDLYEVTNALTNTFEITETFAGNDATGTFRHGTHAAVGAGQGGDYVYIAAISATASNANTTFEFTVILDTTTNGITRRKFSTNTDVGSVVVLGAFTAEAGDHVSLGVRNITSSQNITINEATVVIFKIS